MNAAGRIDFPRVWETGRMFFAPVKTPADVVGVGLTGTGSRPTARTGKAPEDLRVLAGTTDLEDSLVTVKDASGRAVWSNDDTPVTQLFGRRDLARNYLHYRPPFELPEGSHLATEVLGVNNEQDGNLVFMCDPVNAPKREVTLPKGAYPFSLVLALNLAGTASESKGVDTPVSQQSSTLIWGAGTDLEAVQIRIRGVDKEYWMDDPTPIWAVCGLATSSQIITQLWPRAYLIPPGGSLRVESQSPATGQESNGHIYFFGARW